MAELINWVTIQILYWNLVYQVLCFISFIAVVIMLIKSKKIADKALQIESKSINEVIKLKVERNKKDMQLNVTEDIISWECIVIKPDSNREAKRLFDKLNKMESTGKIRYKITTDIIDKYKLGKNYTHIVLRKSWQITLIEVKKEKLTNFRKNINIKTMKEANKFIEKLSSNKSK